MGLPGSQGSVPLISPDGKSRQVFLEQDVGLMLSRGWSRTGDPVAVSTEGGNAVVSSDSIETMDAQGHRYGMLSASDEQAMFREDEAERKYGDRIGSAIALGAARGLTFGLSDAALTQGGFIDKETVSGIRDANVGASLGGEFVTILGTGVAGLGKGALARALQKTPAGFIASKAAEAGAKGTGAFVGAMAGESALYGMGQEVSNIALSNEPVAAETAVWEILKSGGTAGLFGGLGGAAFKGGEKAYRAAKKAKAIPHFDPTKAEGEVFLGGVASRVKGVMDDGDAILAKVTAPPKAPEVPSELDDLAVAWQGLDTAPNKAVDESMDRIMAMRNEQRMSDTFKDGLRRDFARDAGKMKGKAKDFDPAIFKGKGAPEPVPEFKVPEGMEEAGAAFKAAQKNLRKTLGGDPTMASMAKVLNGGPEDILKLRDAMSAHSDAMVNMAKVSKDKEAIKLARNNMKGVVKHIKQSLPKEAVEGAKHLDLAQLGGVAVAGEYVLPNEGPYDELFKAALVYSMLRGKGKNPQAVNKLFEAAPGKASAKIGSSTKAALSAGGAGSARGLIKGNSLFTRGVKGAIGMAAYKGTGSLLERMASPQGLFQLSGRSNSQIGQAVSRMLKKSTRVAMGGGGAAAMIKTLKFAEDSEKEADEQEEGLQKLFAKKADSLRKLASDPMRLAQDLYDATTDLRGVHGTFGDKVETGLGRTIGYLQMRAPKDPGTMHMMGISTWRPDDFQLHEFADVIQGATDPISVIDGVKDGSISITAAQAFRDVYPETFAQMQVEIAKRAGEISEALTYDEQNRLSILMGVPVNSVTTPEYMQFIVEQYTQRQADQAQSMGNVDANALMQGTPTQAQTLLARGNKR